MNEEPAPIGDRIWIIFGWPRRPLLPRPWRWFVKRPFDHCWALVWHAAEPGCVAVEWMFNGMRVEPFGPARTLDVLAELRRARPIVLSMAPRVPPGPTWPQPAWTCAGAMARLLGTPASVLRPRALHRHMLAAGAWCPLAEPEPDDGPNIQRPEDQRPGAVA